MKYVPIPCARDCPERTGDCHGRCEKYKEYADYKEWRRNQRIRKPADEYSIDITMRGKNNYYRRHKK